MSQLCLLLWTVTKLYLSNHKLCFVHQMNMLKYCKSNWKKMLILFILYWHISTFDHSFLVMPTTEPPLLLVTLNHYCLVTLGLTSDIRWVTPNHWGASCLLYPTSSWVSVATAYAYILTHIYLKKLHPKKNMWDQFIALHS